MTYELMVFVATAAPQNRTAFLAWYEAQTQWREDHSYDDIGVCAPALRAWFAEMMQLFPDANSPFSSDEEIEHDGYFTEYSFGREVIHACFPWTKADEVDRAALTLAAKHGVGVFNPSSHKAPIWLPDGEGHLNVTDRWRER
jgi:hypothetical protein